MARKRSSLNSRLGHLRALKETKQKTAASSQYQEKRIETPEKDQTDNQNPNQASQSVEKKNSGGRDISALRRMSGKVKLSESNGSGKSQQQKSADNIHSALNDQFRSDKLASLDNQSSLSALLSMGWRQIGEFVFHRQTVLPLKIGALQPDLLNPCNMPCIYYDTETTGLSTGAGSLIFLAGFGVVDRESFILDQYFLSDYPGEPLFLEAVKKHFFNDHLYVSYNGRSFDYHQFKQRFIMNGIPFAMGPQLDLLYPSRRLWKRIIGSCSLGDLEREILDIKRVEDIPGSEVPQRWFDFLKTNRTSLLSPVFAHHLEDIHTLHTLHHYIAGILNNPADYLSAIDVPGTGRWLLQLDPGKGESLLAASFRIHFDNTTAVFTPPHLFAVETVLLLGKMFKRRRDYSLALEAYNILWNRLENCLKNSPTGCFSDSDLSIQFYRAGVELCKLLEHQFKDWNAALGILEIVIPFCRDHLSREKSGSVLADLDKRKSRLDQKIDRPLAVVKNLKVSEG